ncbi:MAG: bacteriohemerythrin [Treponema sp.]|jgi:hemerythrin|nr:bacteriohemerythrin [Treponema sp.]
MRINNPGGSSFHIVFFEVLFYYNSMVNWTDEYSVGNSLIDEQHKELIRMTNELYDACLKGGGAERIFFLRVMHGSVDYVKNHFSTEENIMKEVNYPDYEVHKKEHEGFIAEVLQEAKNYENNRPFVPLSFVKFLLEWIVKHIAESDKKYAPYLPPEKKDP